MAITSQENSIGAWAFLIGVIIAVVVGLSASLIPIPSLTKSSQIIYLTLIVLGLIVGFSINVSKKESQTFLITGVILVIVSKFGMESVRSSLIGVGVGDTVSSVFAALLVLFIPATIIVSLKTLFSLAKI
ncbi:MAG: hypothetical protein AABW81_03665 [Nanoarchaeota archaeon]